MGVKNLWRLLLPVGHRLSIETLSHQTLAIDASIWLTQISKACRDPETGRLLPNKPHVRIFLLRLMRLLYHQIKPVVVFDGAMPEVKRREIQRRKDRREKLWRDDEDGSAGGGALKRAAKKILVKQLKEWREKEARSKKKNDGKDDGVVGNEEEKKNGSNAVTRSQTSNGAFAAGFTLGDDEEDEAVDNSSQEQQQLNPSKKVTASNKNKTDENDEVISINSKDDDSREEAKQKFQSGLDNFQQEHGDESENDWEMSHAVQSSINESIQQKSSSNTNEKDDDDNDAGNETSFNADANPFDHDHYQKADIDTIASLPIEARHQWIDSQWKAQRIQSRRECIQAAANPEDYSSTQLKNFLKASKLTKQVGEIGKIVKTRKEEDAQDGGGGGFAVSSNDILSNAHRDQPALQRLKRHTNSHSKDDDDEDNELFNPSNNASATGRASMKVLFGEDDSDDDSAGGGGFLVSSPAEATANAAPSAQKKSEENEVVLLDDDSESDDAVSTKAKSASHTKNNEVASKYNTANLKAPPPSDTTHTFQPTKFLALSTAGQEWEEWGGETSNNNTTSLEEETDIINETSAKNCNTDTIVLDATESESDDDEGQDGTFLMLGSATKPGTASAVMEKVVENTEKTSVNPIVADTEMQSVADTEEEDEDDVDWEDGDSDVDQVEDEVDTTNSDDAKNAAKEPNVGNHRDTNSGDNHHSAREVATAPRDSSKTESSISVEIRTASLENGANKKSSEVDDKQDAIDISSEDNASVERVDVAGERVLLGSRSPPGNSKKEPLAIYSSDEDPAENEFESYHADNPQAVALQHAQETASRLTSWAGRAFQRAMSAHAGPHRYSDSPNKKEDLAKEEIDLTSHDVIGVDASVNGAKDSTKANYLDGNQDMPPKHQQSRTQPVLFDTSLEGLNVAHNAILEEEKAMERDMSTITDEMKDDILNLLNLCGIPWIESPSEAEAQCAALEELGLVDGTVTEDSDIFVFGGRKVYKNFFNEQKFVEAYFARDIERDLALKKNQLVALAMLLGGDYTDGVKGIGIVNGMEVLQAFTIDDSADGIKAGLQRFREWLDGFGDPSESQDHSDKSWLSKESLFHKKHKSARTRWVAPADFPSQAIISAYLTPAVDKSEASFTWGTPDLNALQQYCAETIGWEREETDRVVNPVLKVLESGSKQMRLESYFMKYEDGIKFAKVRSKRLKAVLDDIQGDNSNDIECAIAADDAEIEASGANESTKPKKKRQRKK